MKQSRSFFPTREVAKQFVETRRDGVHVKLSDATYARYDKDGKPTKEYNYVLVECSW